MYALLLYIRHNYPLTFLFRHRTYVCGVWGYKYSGTSKNTGIEWNARYTNFVPFLCGLTESLVPLLKKICSLEVASKLLFQRPMSEIQQVFGFFFMFPCVSSCQYSFFYYQALTTMNMPFQDKDAAVRKSCDRMHPLKKK